MTSSPKQHVLWVARHDAPETPAAELRERAGVDDTTMEVRVERLTQWTPAVIPAGSRDEWGDEVPVLLNVWANQLPPEGRIFVIDAS